MKKTTSQFLCFLVIIGLCISCNNSTKESELNLKEKELALKEKELELKEKSIKLNEDSIKLRHLEVSDNASPAKDTSNSQAFISKNQASETVEVNQGKTKFCYVFVSTDEPEIKLESKFLPSGSIDSKLGAVPTFYSYKSSIIEIKNFNEDEKYRVTDKYEAQVRQGFSIKNMQLNEYNSECKILSSECFVFDSYKAASQHRRNR